LDPTDRFFARGPQKFEGEMHYRVFAYKPLLYAPNDTDFEYSRRPQRRTKSKNVMNIDQGIPPVGEANKFEQI